MRMSPKSIPLSVRPLRLASEDIGSDWESRRVTVIVYVSVVCPSSAVTSTEITFSPTASDTVPSVSVISPSLMT